MVADTLSRTMIGHRFKPLEIPWRQKDTMLYALGVGATVKDELPFLYEGKGPAVLPTYAVIPALRAMGNLRQLVKLKVSRLLHGEQAFELLRPLPANTTITLESEVSELWDKGKAAVIGVKATAVDDDGPLFRSHSTLFYLGGGGFGGESGPSTKNKNAPPDRAPDITISYPTSPEQGAIYRLSGDYVPLHIDPEFAQSAGYEKPFMHGLCTYGFAGRAVLHSLCDGDPSRFRSMEGRFASRAEFEDPVITKIWRVTDGEAILQVENQNGEILISQARVTHG